MHERFNAFYAIQGASADLAINFGLNLSTYGGVGLDFSNTGWVKIGNVAGLTYTSDSGVFGTAGGTVSTPEPAALAFLGLGAFGLTVARRRAR